MRKIDLLFAEYAESHQNQTNKLIHWTYVPLIFWTISGVISVIPTPHICFLYFGCISIASMIALFAASIFNFKLSQRTGLIMILLMLLMEYIIYLVNVKFEDRSGIVFLTIFIPLLAWSVLRT